MTDQTLNDQMEFGRVIQVHADGTVTHPKGVYGPEVVYVELDSDGQMIGSDSRDGTDVLVDRWDGWEYMQGYTGQYLSTSRSFIMHASEYIGGRMERDILARPGYYVAVVVDGLPPTEEFNPNEDYNVGWAVAYQRMP
ncbi:hypothetical protein A5747_13430 [Mycobacterium sp. IS-836]|uniref:hypothetical protein n=1 Tax=Mycobacterium sp. IS-836 TaxID=1834160 RepID=UPI00096C531C|nr:hypothetical protein [Mycobacterium sp. IS-836]OMC55389.1 hypothetical protein A5747_13430 [Mycobacterium sp. IS-836]